jgi:hypothetical protein
MADVIRGLPLGEKWMGKRPGKSIYSPGSVCYNRNMQKRSRIQAQFFMRKRQSRSGLKDKGFGGWPRQGILAQSRGFWAKELPGG